MPCLLALDTSTSVSSVALWHQGQIVEDTQLLPRQHAQALLPQIQQLLNTAGINMQQLDALVFGQGPGSFTGLRIAAASIQGLALALDKPAIPISTLQALAWRAIHTLGAQQVVTLLDARMDEVYLAAWHNKDSYPQALMPEQLSRPENLSLPANLTTTATYWVGSGLAYADRFPVGLLPPAQQQNIQLAPNATALLHLALANWHQNLALDPAQALPVYIRDQVTHS